jgi:hypothetical protein
VYYDTTKTLSCAYQTNVCALLKAKSSEQDVGSKNGGGQGGTGGLFRLVLGGLDIHGASKFGRPATWRISHFTHITRRRDHSRDHRSSVLRDDLDAICHSQASEHGKSLEE